jgi:hypothetical protein
VILKNVQGGIMPKNAEPFLKKRAFFPHFFFAALDNQ